MTFLVYLVLSDNLYRSLHSVNETRTILLNRQEQRVGKDRTEAANVTKDNKILTRAENSTKTKAIFQNQHVQNHIFFLKVHKAASSTGMNIMMRFGLSRNLTIMVPKKGLSFSQQTTLKASQILDYSPNSTYDISCNHVVFDKRSIARFMPSDTLYIGTVRHPFSQFKSAFMYYRNTYHLPYLKKIPGPDPMLTYLKSPLRYEPKASRYLSFTDNRMSLDYGAAFIDTEAMKNYVNRLDTEFDFILLVEKFDESLVLLKRLLGWETKDIIYIPHKKRRFRVKKTSQLHESLHTKWARFDYILYAHFKNSFDRLLAAQDKMFYEELDNLKTILSKTQAFCSQNKTNSLVIAQSRWNDEFTIFSSHCAFIKLKSSAMTNMVRNMYLNKKDNKS